MSVLKTLSIAALSACLSAAAFAQPQGDAYQTDSLFGEKLHSEASASKNLTDAETFARVTADAKAAYDAEITPDTATWYGRVLSYQGYYKEAVDIYSKGIEKFPDSAKLRRHRAHRYFTLRQFDKSIEEGLRSAELYEGKPLEREKLGPDYFPSTPDVVQFYLYYHLGQAYFAKGEYSEAAKWFEHSLDVSRWVNDAPGITAGVYWTYISLGRAGEFDAALELLNGYDMALAELSDNIESNYYFDGIQLFKGHREPGPYFSNVDTGKAFSNASGTASSTAFTLANFYLFDGQREEAKEWFRRSINVDGWSYFARIQSEADWRDLYPGETP